MVEEKSYDAALIVANIKKYWKFQFIRLLCWDNQ